MLRSCRGASLFCEARRFDLSLSRTTAPHRRPLPYPSAEELRRFVAEKAYLRAASQGGKRLSNKCPENGYEPSATYPHTGQGARGRLPA